MKRILLFAFLAGMLTAGSGCGLCQSVFCYHPCGGCGCGGCGNECDDCCAPACRPACHPVGGACPVPNGGRRLRRWMRLRVRAALPQSGLPQFLSLRRLRLRSLCRSLRQRLLLRPTLVSRAVELPVRFVHAELLLRAELRQALLGRLLQRSARLLGSMRSKRQLHRRRMPQLRRFPPHARTRRLYRQQRPGCRRNGVRSAVVRDDEPCPEADSRGQRNPVRSDQQ